MKRSKKSIVLILLTIIMLISSMVLAGCGSSKTEDSKDKVQTEQSADKAVTADGDGQAADEPSDQEEKTSKEDKDDSKTDNSAKKETTKSTQPATQATKPTEAAKVCYVSVEGYCSGKAVTLQGGDTAYSVLKRTGAAVSAEGTEYGLYVEGINGRFASGSSGWKYSVNGYEPNTSSNNYKVKSGDSVRWYWGSAN